jgi:hypothetical protein
LELFFKFLGPTVKSLLQIDFKETEGPLCKIPEITDFRI